MLLAKMRFFVLMRTKFIDFIAHLCQIFMTGEHTCYTNYGTGLVWTRDIRQKHILQTRQYC